MLSPAAAAEIILAHSPLFPTEDCPLASAHGRILRSPVHADRDLPPFDRVTLDGYAVRAATVVPGQPLRIAGTQAAGMMPLTLPAPDTCVEIATGAVLPTGADAVIPYEESAPDPSGTVTFAAAPTLGAAIHRRASDHPAGTALLSPGTRLTGREIAVAASVGAATLRVAMRPSAAIVATGDELVEVDTPAISPHQIRKSNDHALRAALLASGLVARADRFHLRDRATEIESGLRRILAEFDIVLLTGGVSRGKFDHVPRVLAALGVEKQFQGVAQRPGKPFWFGLSPRRLPVFALPGNPVSTYTCLHRYVLPSLARMAGATPPPPDFVPLAAPVAFKSPLALFLPITLATTPQGQRTATPVPFNTSGDFAALIGTSGFVELPPGPVQLPAATALPFTPWT